MGLLAFVYPFWLPVLAQHNTAMGMAHAADAPLLLTLLVGICFVALLLEVQGPGISARFVALLGVLVALNSLLRFLDVALPAIGGGFSPIFMLMVLTGYVYGARAGFLMGTMTLVVSALITGGIGPWLPYQMFTAGWIGLSAPLCAPLVRLLHGEDTWREVAVLALFGALWGLLYGALMNIWFWPFASGPAEQSWQAGLGFGAGVQRYLLFYLLTSLVWDSFRAAGNAALIAAFGLPTLRALRRFRQRFDFRYEPASEV